MQTEKLFIEVFQITAEKKNCKREQAQNEYKHYYINNEQWT